MISTRRGDGGPQDRSKRMVRLAALVLPAVVLISGCEVAPPPGGEGSGGDKVACTRSTEKVIGWDFPLSSNLAYQTLADGVAEAAAKRGYRVVFTTNNGNLEQQVNDLRTWIMQDLPAMASYAIEPASVEPIAAQARANCTGFVSYGAEMKNMDAYVGYDWALGGVLQGKHAVEWAKKYRQPVRALILKDTDSSAGKGRYDGLMSVFPGDARNVSILGDQKANNLQTGEQVTSTVLQAHPDLNMVLAYNDDVAMGARQAFLNAGRSDRDFEIYISGIDGTLSALELVKRGTLMRVTVANPLDAVVKMIANTTIDVAEGKEPDDVRIAPTVLTYEDQRELDQFIAHYR